jgi:hypothetical protein
MRLRPSPHLSRDRGTQAAEYPVDDFSDRLKGLPPYAVRARKHVDYRCSGSRLHDPQSGRGAFASAQEFIASGASRV